MDKKSQKVMPLRKVQFILKNFTDESTNDNPILLEKIPWAVGIANITRHGICLLSDKCLLNNKAGWSFIPEFSNLFMTHEGNEATFKHFLGNRILLRILVRNESGLSEEQVVVDIYYKD